MIAESEFEAIWFRSLNILMLIAVCFFMRREIKKLCRSKEKALNNSQSLIHKKLGTTPLKEIKLETPKINHERIVLKLPVDKSFNTENTQYSRREYGRRY